MYQAIVFLPLLGAILAGLIALAGARARFPARARRRVVKTMRPVMVPTMEARLVTLRIMLRSMRLRRWARVRPS